MKNIHRSLVAAVIAASLAVTACSPAEDGAVGEEKGASASALTLQDNNGEQELHPPYERVAVTDNRAFEILSDWGQYRGGSPRPGAGYPFQRHQ